jgi:hypothetical protein
MICSQLLVLPKYRVTARRVYRTTEVGVGKGPVAGKPTSKPLERYVRIVDQGQCFGPAHCCAGI